MSIKQISNWLRNTGTVATAVAASTVVTGLLAPAASAATLKTFDLVRHPENDPQEGEIDVGLVCIEECIELDPLIQSVESLVDASTGSKSRLFIDNLRTESIYTDTSGSDIVRLLAGDKGTNPEGFWFRPSTDEEEGRLEVGTYKFTFSQTLAELDFTFFDLDWASNSTGVVAINGDTSRSKFYPAGGNGSQTTDTFKNVKSITLKLGLDHPDFTGDGVDFQLVARLPMPVPEPSTVLGLGAVAIGALGLRKRKNNKV